MLGLGLPRVAFRLRVGLLRPVDLLIALLSTLGFVKSSSPQALAATSLCLLDEAWAAFLAAGMSLDVAPSAGFGRRPFTYKLPFFAPVIEPSLNTKLHTSAWDTHPDSASCPHQLQPCLQKRT